MQVVKKVAVGGYPEGVGFAPDGKRAYVVNWMDDNVTIIDPADDKVLGYFDGGRNNRSVGKFIGK